MSNIKCPFCQQELKYDAWNEVYMCRNPNCKHLLGFGTKELWQELIRTRKALEVALAELQEIDGVCDDNKYTDNLYIGLDGQDTRNIALDVKKALEQITAEQKE